MRHEIRQGHESHEQAETDTTGERDDGGLGEELATDIGCGRTKRLADADLPCALRYGHQHDVHDADASQCECQQRDGAEEESHHMEDAVQKLRAVECVPHPQCVEVERVEVVPVAEHLPYLPKCCFVQF